MSAFALRPSAATCTGECQKSGPLGLLVILGLCIACYFLFKSFSGHLRRVRENFPADGFPVAPPAAGPPAGGVAGADVVKRAVTRPALERSVEPEPGPDGEPDGAPEPGAELDGGAAPATAPPDELPT